MFSTRIGIWSGLIVIIFCLAGTILLTFTDMMKHVIEDERRGWLSVILGSYAVFRSVRIVGAIKKLKRQNERKI